MKLVGRPHIGAGPGGPAARLNELRSEHRDLDDVIARISESQPFDQLQVQVLKKRKLGLKDEILQLEAELLPDIIA
jgi:hypothetical protein